MNSQLSIKFLTAMEVCGGEEKRKLLAEAIKTGKLDDALEIEGVLLDDSKNLNNWRLPESEFDTLAVSLKGAPYLKDHEEKVDNIAGQVVDVWRDGNIMRFKAEIDDDDLKRKILKGRVKYSSVQLDSDAILCSVCMDEVSKGKLTADEAIKKGQYYSRIDGVFKHLHPKACEVVTKPRGKEVSAVVFPAYKIAEIAPKLGFRAALDNALIVPDNLRSNGYPRLDEDGDVTERDASDIKQGEDKGVKRNMTEETKSSSLTAEEVAKVVITAMEARDAKLEAVKAAQKKEDDYGSFMKTWESAVGKIGELEKNYQAGVTKLEGILTKFEEISKREEEKSKAGKTLAEAKKEKDAEPAEVEEDETEAPVEPIPRKEGGKKEASDKSDKTLTGKAIVSKEEATLKTGLDGKFFPGWYREVVAQARKHPRSEA